MASPRVTGCSGQNTGAPRSIPAALNGAGHQGGGYRPLGPGGDVPVVIKAGHGYLGQGLSPGDGHRHGDEFPPGDRGALLKQVLAAHLPAHIQPGLGQMDGRLVGGAALQIGVSHLSVRLADAHGDGGLGGGVPRRVAHHIGEGVPAGLVLIGGIDELAGAVLRQSHRPAGGSGGQLEGEHIPFGVHRVEVAGDGYVAIGGQFHVPGDGRVVLLVQQIEGHLGLSPLQPGGEYGSEGELGLGLCGGGVDTETQAGQGRGLHHRSGGDGLSSHGQLAAVGIRQAAQGDSGQSLVSAAGKGEVLGGEGDDLSQQAVFGKVHDAGNVESSVPEKGGGGQGHGSKEHECQQQRESSAGGVRVFQRDDLLIQSVSLLSAVPAEICKVTLQHRSLLREPKGQAGRLRW